MSTTNVGLITDSVGDLPEALVETYAVDVVPMTIVMDGKPLRDGIDISREEFYAQLADVKQLPTSAAAGPGEFITRFEAMLASGYEHVLCVLTSSKVSAVCEAARVAAQDFMGKVTIVDSEMVSLGVGFQLMSAAEALRSGLSLEQALDAVKSVRERVHVVALVNTLENLRKGGRVNFLKAGIGTMLDLKLFAGMKDGVIEALESTRTRTKAINRFVAMIEELGPLERLALLYTDNEAEVREIAERLQVELLEPIIIKSATTAIGVHTGPRAMGFAALRAK